MTDSQTFKVELTGEQWYRVIRILTGEAPAETPPRTIANEISAQIWDADRG